MTARTFGLVPGIDDPRDWPVERLLGKASGAAVEPPSLDFRLACDVHDQGQSSSCVGHTFAQMLYVRAIFSGKPIPFPSPLAIYTAGRVYDQGRDVLDVGCTFRSAAKGLATVGAVTEERYPLSAMALNMPLPWDVLRAGSDALAIEGDVIGYWRVAKDAATIRQTLAQGYPVGFGMPVDDAYLEYAGGVYEPGGKQQGLHAQMLCGWPDDANAYVCGSWGKAWGAEGFSVVPWEFIAAKGFDFYALSIAPEVLL